MDSFRSKQLTKLSIIPEIDPKLQRSDSNSTFFKSDVGRAQFIGGLLKWLPIGADPQVFIEEASKYRGVVRDNYTNLQKFGKIRYEERSKYMNTKGT